MASIKTHIVLLLAFTLSLPLVISAMPPAPNYCEHMGYNYTFKENKSQGQGICQFNENTSCTAEAFMNGSCGQEYIKNISCREEGEAVFTEFESCCENLEPYIAPGTMGQPVCQPEKSILQKLSAHIGLIFRVVEALILG